VLPTIKKASQRIPENFQLAATRRVWSFEMV